jgi:hypothetical protein
MMKTILHAVLLSFLLPATAWCERMEIHGPEGSGQFGGAVALLPNGNFVVVNRGYQSDPPGSAYSAVHLYSPAGTLISTLVGGRPNDDLGSGGILVLKNGNFVVLSPKWDGPNDRSDVGAATWVNGMTGLSGKVSEENSLVGSRPFDRVGGQAVELENGHYVVISSTWNHGVVENAGAVTWCNGQTGLTGPVSESNSLVGSSRNDLIGTDGVVPLVNGNYVVISARWNNGAATNAGAVTWGSGAAGTVGLVSAANSLVGVSSSDRVGDAGVVGLTNGNYVVASRSWRKGTLGNVGAVTWANGMTGLAGEVSVANSLVGSTAGDEVGVGGVTALSNGNYVVRSWAWRRGAIIRAGAVTWGDGSTGTVGEVSIHNSLVGSTASDFVGGVTALTNGNYVVWSGLWDNGSTADVGAVTWCNGMTGRTGEVSTSNSLVGAQASDRVGSGWVTALANGNYVVASPDWNHGPLVDVGAVTWADGATGLVGTVTAGNSMIGSTAMDRVGGASNGSVTALTNGHYVIRSPRWDNGAVVDAGAVTWCNGVSGSTGVVSVLNSLVGSSALDTVGRGVGASGDFDGVRALSNGNYVVRSPDWNHGALSRAGAITWGNGEGGTTGVVSSANSLIGSHVNDLIGERFLVAEDDGNYVVVSTSVDNGGLPNRGAVTLGNGSTGSVGPITEVNSVLGKEEGAGDSLVYAYESRLGMLLVGDPESNLVTLWRAPVELVFEVLSPLTLNWRTGLFEQVVRVSNPSTLPMEGFRLTLLNLPPGLEMWNRTHPILPVIEDFSALPPGGFKDVVVAYYSPKRRMPSWTPEYLIEAVTDDLPVLNGDVSGLYHGWVSRDATAHLSAHPNLGARIELTVSKRGAVTGRLIEGAVRHRIRSRLVVDAEDPVRPLLIIPVAGRSMVLRLLFDADNRAGGRLKQVSAAGMGAAVVMWRQVGHDQRLDALPAGYSGAHHFALTNASEEEGPQGYGFGAVRPIGKAGRCSLLGRLPQGQLLLSSTFFGPQGQVLIYQPHDGNRSSCVGNIEVKTGLNAPFDNAIEGTVSWMRVAGPGTPGFGPLELVAEGAAYFPPGPGQRVLDLPEATPMSENGGLEFRSSANFWQGLTVANPSPNGLRNTAKPVNPNPQRVRVTRFDAAKGTFGGNFVLAGDGSRGRFQGLIVPSVSSGIQGFGHCLLPSGSGRVELRRFRRE